MKPVANRISQWGSMTEILYSCPKCGTSFSFYSKDEKFCHRCGTKIDWNDIPLNCGEQTKELYHYKYGDNFEVQKRIIEIINVTINALGGK